MTALSEYLKQRTTDAGMSTKEFARRAGIGFESARRILSGQTKVPKDETLEKIAAALPDVHLRDLRELADVSAEPPEPFAIMTPKEFDLLSQEERHVLRRVLLAVGRQLLISSGKVQSGQRIEQAVENGGATVTRLSGRRRRVTQAAHQRPTKTKGD